jgi:hypothetical protein
MRRKQLNLASLHPLHNLKGIKQQSSIASTSEKLRMRIKGLLGVHFYNP